MVKNRCSRAVFALLLAVLLFALPVSADMLVGTDKSVYSFGDEIVVRYEFSRDQDFSGLVKLSLFCTNFDLEFYTLPTNVYAGEKQQVSVAPLSVSPAMLGRCYVVSNATSYDRLINESAVSNFFNVTNQASVAVEVSQASYLPGSSVEVSGVVGKSHSLPAGVTMSFMGTNYASPVADNHFAYSIRLPKNIKSGRHSLGFIVNDSYGNSGSASAEFSVEAVPTRIANAVSRQSLRPSEQFGVAVSIFDQADDKLQSEVGISVTDSLGAVVFSASNSTDSNVTFAFPEHQKPGSYTLTSSGLGLSAASQLVVEEVQEASVSFDNRTVVLSNTGNVEYAKKFNITLSGRKSYLVSQNVQLAPGEKVEVDLTSIVSEGNYTVAFPTVPSAGEISDVYLEDNRNFLKKTSDLFGISRTGSAVKTGTGTGWIQARFAPLLVFLIVVAVGFYFIRNRGKGGGGSAGRAEFGGSSGSSSTSGGSAEAQQEALESVEDARVRQIMEEKRRQLLERNKIQPKSLRDDPVAQKFVRDMMKEKKFR